MSQELRNCGNRESLLEHMRVCCVFVSNEPAYLERGWDPSQAVRMYMMTRSGRPKGPNM